MTRRIVIEIERVAPEPHSITRFEPYYAATAKIVCNNRPTTIISFGIKRNDAKLAAMEALDGLLPELHAEAPNAHFCHTPLACTLTGRCEKQFGPTGSACCE